MPRPKNAIRTVYKNVGLPEPIAARVDLELYSDLEGKIPFGATSEFFSNILEDYFKKKDKAQKKDKKTGEFDAFN